MAQVTGFDYLKAFDVAAVQVIEEVVGEAPIKGPPIAQFGSSMKLHAVNVQIGIAGSLSGHFRLSMDDETARALAGVMLGEEVAQLDEMSLSALSELGNMIAGNARTALNETGGVSDITPPSILQAEGAKETWYNLNALSVPLTLPFGTIHLAVGIRPATAPRRS